MDKRFEVRYDVGQFGSRAMGCGCQCSRFASIRYMSLRRMRSSTSSPLAVMQAAGVSHQGDLSVSSWKGRALFIGRENPGIPTKWKLH